MKIWIGHGSEHSYNLVMIGYFADEKSARSAEQKFQRLGAAVESELPDLAWDADQRFTSGMRELLDELKTWDLSRSDLENFAYEHTIRRSGKELRIETDEGEVQGFLKLLIGEGARIEVYSAHEWTAEGMPRTEQTEGQTEEQADD
jgi:hypothetical protein